MESAPSATDSASRPNAPMVAEESNTAVADPKTKRTGGEPDGNVAPPSTGDEEAAVKPRPRRRRRRSKRAGVAATTESIGEESPDRNRAPADEVAPSPAADSGGG